MSAQRDLDNAVKLFRDFREAEPRRVADIDIEVPDVVMIVGRLTALEYFTTHGRKAALYRHDFAPGSRPYMAAGTKRGQLFLVGGRFAITKDGVTDFDSKGRIVDYEPRGRCPTCARPMDTHE